MSKITNVLVETIGIENAISLMDMCERVKGRAIERKSEQTVTIVFSHKGFVRHINGSDNVNGIEPKMYEPE